MIEINGMKWEPLEGVTYQHDYAQIVREIAEGKYTERDGLRTLMQTDLWALVYFGLRIEVAHKPFVVAACAEVQDGPDTLTLDIWAREHFKTTILSVARTIQDLLNDPNMRICIFSYTKEAALAIFRNVKNHFEFNSFLKDLFSDIIPADRRDAVQWSEDGIVLKRSKILKEASLEAFGLVEGMPTGRHYDKLIYDDISVEAMARNPELMAKVKEKFDMSVFVGSEGSKLVVVGTFYDDNDPLVYIRSKVKPDGSPMFLTRYKPCTEDGTYTGRLVLISKERNEVLLSNRKTYATQMLCDPTPKEDITLHWNRVNFCALSKVPNNLFRFMLIDPAGDRKDKKKGDQWAIWLLGVEPFIQDIGLSRVFVLDGFLEVVDHDVGVAKVAEMYVRGGWIRQIAVEKVGASTAEIHIAGALRARGRSVTLENEMLTLVQPSGRSKEARISDNLAGLVKAGLFTITDGVPQAVQERLRFEFERFPNGRYDDGIDALAYLPDVLKKFPFPKFSQDEPKVRAKVDEWDRAFEKAYRDQRAVSRGWMKG